MTAVAAPPSATAPARRGYPVGWWGMAALIATEASVFAALLSAYFFVRAISPEWPQDGLPPPDLVRASIFTVVLLASSIPVHLAEVSVRDGHVGRLRVALLVGFVMGASFLVNQIVEFDRLEFEPTANAYASLFVVITGLHGLHVLAGLVMSAVVQLKARLGALDADHHVTVSVFTMYWHFVDAVWIAVFASLYLGAHVR